tara:strand:+ start:274 stop:834 length:561 start_codon:yes stop_codon:yes gene_type:complete
MAISLDATVGGTSANTYITLSDANAIVEGLVLDADVSAWDGSTTDNKNRALFTAAQRIDRERFLGARVADSQALQWPRSGVRKPDTYTNLYGLSFPNRLVADYYLDTEIPDRVKKAQVILAVYLNNNRDALGLSGLENFNAVSIGSINVTPRFFGAVGADNVPPLFQEYLNGIRISTPANISIKRS